MPPTLADNLLHALATKSQGQSSTLTNLPTELLVKVFRNLDGASRICLALSCKKTAKYGDLFNMRLTFPSTELRQNLDWLLFM
jgi:F-box domain